MVAYEGSEPFVFVSYAHKDKNKVLPIVEGLQNRGFRVWYDKRGISAGDEWAEVIANHLENCCCMVAFVSRSFGASNNCREELNYAKELKKTILVVYLEDRNNLRGAVRMQLSTLHSLSMDEYPGNDAFLEEISGEEALQPCLAAAAEPVKPAEPSAEELYEQGRVFFDQKEYQKATPLFSKAAEQGHAVAQFNLGWCYEHGDGVPKNYREAVNWYWKAAEQGHPMAQNNLGYFYQHGLGMPRDYDEAVKWYHKAVKQNCASAQNNLGTCYQRGEGVPRNFEKAVKWYSEAANQGYALAQTNLGWCYENGKGVPQNYEEAIKWYSKATTQGEVNAQYMLGLCYEYGRGVQKNITEARKWYQKAADQGDKDAIEKLKCL